MPRALIVEIFGDARQFSAELDKAAGKTRRLGAVAGLAGAAIATGLAIGLEKSVKAAIKAQEEQGKLDQAFRNAGVSVDKMTGKTEQLEAANRKLGFTNNDTRESLTKLVTAGDNVKKATTDMAEAADLARYKQISLGDATTALIKIHAGNARALKEVGIVMPAVTSAADALTEKHKALSKEAQKATDASFKHELALAKVQDKMDTGQKAAELLGKKIHDQADEFSQSAAGGMEQFHAQLGALEEKIGSGLLPAVTAMIQGIDHAINYVVQNWPTINRTIAPLMQQVRQIIQIVLADAEAFWKRFGSTITTVVLDITRVVGAQFKLVADIFRVVGDLLRGDWSKLWADLKKICVDVLNVLLAILHAQWDAFKAAFHGIGNAAVNGLEAGLAALDNVTREAINTVLALIRSIPGRILAALGDLSHLLYNAGSSIIQGLIDGLKARLGEVEGIASGIAHKIAGLKGPIEYDRRLLIPHGQAIIEGLQAGMESALPGLYGSVGKIAPRIALATTSNAAAGNGGGGSGGVTVIVNGDVTGDELVRKVRRELEQMARRGTQLGFA